MRFEADSLLIIAPAVLPDSIPAPMPVPDYAGSLVPWAFALLLAFALVAVIGTLRGSR